MNLSGSSQPTSPARYARAHIAKGLVSASVFCTLLLAGYLAWNKFQAGRWENSLRLAEKSLAAGDLPAGYQHLQQAAVSAPASARISRRLAEVAIQQGLLTDAERWIIQLPSTEDNTKSRLLLAAAEQGLKQGDATRTEKWLLAVPADDGDRRDARRKLMELYSRTFRQNDLRREITLQDQADPNQKWEPALLVSYCLGRRMPLRDKQRGWLELALRSDPTNVHIISAEAQRLTRLRDNSAAQRILIQVPEASKTSEITLLRVQRLIETGAISEAKHLLQGLGEVARSDARYWTAMAQLSLESDDDSTARTDLQTATYIDPFDPEPEYQLGRLESRVGSDLTARSHFQRADLLSELARMSATFHPESRQDKQAELLVKIAKATHQLGFSRLSLLLLRTVPQSDLQRLSATGLLAELGKSSEASKPLSETDSGLRLSNSRVQEFAKAALARTKVELSRTDQSSSYGNAPLFWDIAESVGLNFQFRGTPTPRDKPLMINVLGGGIAVLDFDADGWPDLFFSQGCPLPVSAQPDEGIGRLFRNLRGKKFEEITDRAQLSSFGFGQGCAVGDFDNDGFADLLVCQFGGLRLHHNNGDGTFREVASGSGLSDPGWSSSAVFGDFDRDGDLDLFVVHYVSDPWPNEGCCLPLSFRPTQNAIWENAGDGRFIDRSTESGVQATVTQLQIKSRGDPGSVEVSAEPKLAKAYGLAVVAEDLDNDGWLDLYLANDMTPNFLFRNNGAPSSTGRSPFSFVEIGIASGVATNGKGEVEAGMGLTCGDVDGDGFFDLFVTNFETETNTLYRNHGQMSFADDTARSGLLDLNPPKMGWGCQFLDSRGRGEMDLFLVNSHLREESPQTPSFYSNRNGRFREIKLGIPYFQTERMGRATALVDWNRDTRPDLAVGYLTGNVSLLNNESSLGNRFAVEVVGRTSNRDGAGARVTVNYGDRTRNYRVSRGGGFLAANDKQLSIGLGSFPVAQWEITWPSGHKQSCGTAQSGSHYLVIEGQPPIPLPGP